MSGLSLRKLWGYVWDHGTWPRSKVDLSLLLVSLLSWLAEWCDVVCTLYIVYTWRPVPTLLMLVLTPNWPRFPSPPCILITRAVAAAAGDVQRHGD